MTKIEASTKLGRAFPRQVRDQGSYEWRCRSDRDQVGHRSIVRLPPSGYELYVQMSWMRRWRAFGNDRGGAARLRRNVT